METITNTTPSETVSTEMPKSNKNKLIVLVAFVLVLISAGVYFFLNRTPAFCFDFTSDMKFGDREGQTSPFMLKGVPYFPYEVSGLQKALQEEGNYIDPLELDGGGIYPSAFFGASTQVGVREFQKKYGFEQDGLVDEEELLKLKELYSCPVPVVSTTATSTATTTLQK